MDYKEELAAQKQKIDSFKLSLTEENKKFNELKTSFAKMKEKMPPDGEMSPEDEKMKKMMDTMYSMADYLHQRVDNCNKMIGECMDKQYSHAGLSHLPPLNAGALNKLLSVAGLSEDYTVAKKTLYTYASVKDKFEVEMTDNQKP